MKEESWKKSEIHQQGSVDMCVCVVLYGIAVVAAVVSCLQSLVLPYFDDILLLVKKTQYRKKQQNLRNVGTETDCFLTITMWSDNAIPSKILISNGHSVVAI